MPHGDGSSARKKADNHASLNELFNLDFMRKYANFSSIEGFFEFGGEEYAVNKYITITFVSIGKSKADLERTVLDYLYGKNK